MIPAVVEVGVLGVVSVNCDTPSVTTLSGLRMMTILLAMERLGIVSDPCSKACNSISGLSLVASLVAVTTVERQRHGM